MGPAALARGRGRRGAAVAAQLGQGTRHPRRSGGAGVAGFTHVVLLDGDLQHLPAEAARLLDAATHRVCRPGPRRARVQPRGDAGVALSCESARHQGAVGFLGVPLRDTQCGFRVVRLERARGSSGCAAAATRSKPRCWSSCGGAAPVLPRCRSRRSTPGRLSKLRPVRDTTKTCFLAVYYRYIERL